MSRYIEFGIDLGTTNSCLARMEGGGPQVIQNNDQMNVTPSVVRVLKSGSLMTGRRAYNAIVEDPDNVALEFKRVMGQKYEKTFPASGRVMTPEELSAEVLKALAADARRRAGVEVRAACITVPAAFLVMIVVSLLTPRHVPLNIHRIMVRLHVPEGLAQDTGDFTR